ncbi:hypothetical protein STENM223S_00903 [Streptomyces tendae]
MLRDPDARGRGLRADERLTYRAARRAGEPVGAWLVRARAWARRALVAVALPRSADLVAGLLGGTEGRAARTCRSTRSTPADRLAHVLEDAAPALVLTDTGDRGAVLPADPRCLHRWTGPRRLARGAAAVTGASRRAPGRCARTTWRT